MNFDPMMTQSVDSVFELCNYETPGFSPNCYSTSSNFEALAGLINAAELQQKQPIAHGIGPMQPDRSFANAQQQNQTWLINKFQSLFGSAYLAKATAHFVAQQIYAGKHMEDNDPDEPDVFAYKTSKGRFTADDRVFDEEQNYLKYLEATKQARKKIREPSSVEEFFQLFDVPYGSALPEYELFAEGFCFSKHGNPSDEFNKRVYEAKALSAEEYDEMRRDFNSNGREAAPLTTLFEDYDYMYPPLEVHPEKADESKQIWEDTSFETMNQTPNNFAAHGDCALQDFVAKRGRGGKKSFEGVSLTHVVVFGLPSFDFSFTSVLRVLQEHQIGREDVQESLSQGQPRKSFVSSSSSVQVPCLRSRWRLWWVRWANVKIFFNKFLISPSAHLAVLSSLQQRRVR